MTRTKFLHRVAVAALLCSALLTPAAAQTGGEGRGVRVPDAPVARFENNADASLRDTVRRPLYRVRLISFHAIDETGPDWSGSDEIFAVYQTDAYHVATATYGNIDSGDTQRVAGRQACIYPAVDNDGRLNQRWACDLDGAPGPIDFRVSLYETDGNVPWRWGACLHGGASDLLPREEALRCSMESVSLVFSYGRSISEGALAVMLPESYTHRDFEERGANYSIVYRIERMGDLIVEQERELSR